MSPGLIPMKETLRLRLVLRGSCFDLERFENPEISFHGVSVSPNR